MNNKSQRTYWDNIAALRKRPNREVFDKSILLMQSENARFREIGINVSAQLGIPPRPFYNETLKLYFDLLSGENEPAVLSTLLYAIGHNNDKLTHSQIQTLVSFKDFRDSFVREALVNALLGVEDAIAIYTLLYLSEDTAASVRNWATFGIGTLVDSDNEMIRAALWKRVSDRNIDTKFEAIAGLAKRKDIRIKDIIEKELLSGDYQSLLFDAITDLGDIHFLPILKSQLVSNEQNKNVNNEWLKSLKNCITSLENRTPNSK
ncbi:hypothetical protein AAEO56_16040 [Flavobacterium sp. DGU11]|uniref:HEAT repeat-containing protein n=2 Tax=Flavobacterium arundinis TaxID=3139143 RepID=A0ABU9I187_9FLAO